MTGRHEGKVAVVTGGGAGIGLGIATVLGREGATIVLAELDPKHGEEAVRGLKEAGIEAHAYTCDVSDPEQVEKTINGAIADLGRLDILVNNAGVSLIGPYTDQTEVASWDRSIGVMQSGVFYCSRVAGRHFLEQGQGCIVNITSIRGFSPNPGRLAYCAAKAAVIMMTKVMAGEWGSRGVRVNAIAPGVTKTALWDAAVEKGHLNEAHYLGTVPAGRLARTEEIGHLASFLCSDEAAYINGETVTIDGGLTVIPSG